MHQYSDSVNLIRKADTGLGAHYYTSDPKEVKALVADENYVMAEEELFFFSNKPAKGLRPVYKFEDLANGTFIWSRSDEESLDIEMGSEITTYTNKGIAWFTEEHNSTFDPSNPLNSDLISDLMAFYILDLAEMLITLLTITTYLKGIHHLQVILTYPRKTQIP